MNDIVINESRYVSSTQNNAGDLKAEFDMPYANNHPSSQDVVRCS